MDSKTYQKQWEAERAERAAKPWLIRIMLNFGEFMRYRFMSRVKDFPQEVKWKLSFWAIAYAIVGLVQVNKHSHRD